MIGAIDVGATVHDADGEFGTVEAVATDPTTGTPSRIVIRTREGRRVEAPVASIDPTSTAHQVRLTVAGRALGTVAEGATSRRALEAVGDRLVVPVHEEVLVPTTRPVELGTVRIHKRVETVPAEALVDVMRDDVTVERVPVDRPVDAVPAPRQEGDTLVIPVVEEVLVTEKRLVLREEVRVTRRQRAETVAVRDTVRREVLEVEEQTVAATQPAAATGITPAPAAADASGDDLPPT